MGISNSDLDQILKRPAMAKANKVGYPAPIAKLEHHPKHEPLEKAEAKEASPRKCLLSFEGFRIQRQDPDGLSVKWAIDALRYAGLLEDDTHEHVEIIMKPQIRVKTKAEERTELTISWL